MLTLTHITKVYGNRRVLNNLDLEVGAGQSVAMLGANGSGKTTTLRCIIGLARPDVGRIIVGGIDLARDPLRARGCLSYLPQKSVFPPTLTVRETLAVVARLRGTPVIAVDRELDSCGLVALADRGVGHLSGGERQRLAIAVAFVPSVDVYLFDEPSANLDPVASRMLFERLRQLKRDGHTLLLTTHIPADVVTWRRELCCSATDGLSPRPPGNSNSAATNGCWSATCGETNMKSWCLIFAVALASASATHCAKPGVSPEPLPLDRVECARCRMLISIERGSGEIVSTTAETRFYDDIGCLAADWVAHHGEARAFVRIAGDRWSDVHAAFFAQPADVRTAMGSGIVGFAAAGDARAADHAGRVLTFDDLVERSGVRQ